MPESISTTLPEMRINPAKVGGVVAIATILTLLSWGVVSWLQSPDDAPVKGVPSSNKSSAQPAAVGSYSGVPYSSSLEEKVLTFSLLYASPPSPLINQYLKELSVSEQAFNRLNRVDGTSPEAARRANLVTVRIDRKIDPDLDVSEYNGGILVDSTAVLKFYKNGRFWLTLEATHQTVWADVFGEWKLVGVIS